MEDIVLAITDPIMVNPWCTGNINSFFLILGERSAGKQRGTGNIRMLAMMMAISGHIFFLLGCNPEALTIAGTDDPAEYHSKMLPLPAQLAAKEEATPVSTGQCRTDQCLVY